MTHFFIILTLLLTWINPLAAPVAHADAPSPDAVVRAVLFYSPSCGHCHLVINEVLPPLFEKYGDQLDIVGIDITQPGGQALFHAVLAHFNLESAGVPLLVIGDTYLIGSVEIPEKFPGLIEQHLAEGGLDWPPIPALAEALASAEPATTSTPAPPEAAVTAAATPTPAFDSTTQASVTHTPTPGLLLSKNSPSGDLGATFARDPLGNSLAVIVLIGILLSAGGAVLFLRHKPVTGVAPAARSWGWWVPILCLVGLGVAGYLAYVETTQVEAVCGPVGDCNTVQQSQYARLFGWLPIGVLGMAGYVMILLAWIVGCYASQRLAAYASLAQLGLTTFGLLFSIYLTFLEPFVIGAACAWCLTSAILMTILFWLSLAPARLAYSLLRHGEESSFKPRSNTPAETR